MGLAFPACNTFQLGFVRPAMNRNTHILAQCKLSRHMTLGNASSVGWTYNERSPWDLEWQMWPLSQVCYP